MKSLAKFLASKYRQDSAPRKRKVRVIDEKTIFFLVAKILEEEYGKRGVASVVPRYFDGRKLFLSCKSSLWVEEVIAFRADLLRRLSEQGVDSVTDIKASHEYGR
ncbi:MAG: hypothetical protein IPJ67_04805 [Candidatus Moraniibacteriota bacterium]|nr:MAG: hypothetical protein IPJ67_04805 [Candidatus Moranbacteria bacterium]